MDTKGQQLLLDVWLAEDLTAELLAGLCDAVRRRFSVVAESRWDFDPQGTTVTFILSESHFALHTYPERRYFSLDLYICNLGVDLRLFQEEILAGLKVNRMDAVVRLRGHPPPRSEEERPGFVAASRQ